VAEQLVEPVTMAEARLRLRLDVPDDDPTLESLIIAAREHIENVCDGLVLAARTVTEVIRLDRPYAELTAWPIAEPARIALATAGGEVAQAEWLALYTGEKQLKRRPVRIEPVGGAWGRERGVIATATVQAGWSDPQSVPVVLCNAILMLVLHWYTNGSASTPGELKETPLGVAAMIRRFQVQTI